MVATINDPITLDGVPYQTTCGIRADTTSRGNDLAGAVVVATYSDGTTENLTWMAFDPYSLGGATGTDIAMSYGYEYQTLTTTKLLTSLEINLAPANSVFDITLTAEGEIDGINTPTSKNGFPFKIVSVDEAETGSVTATYSNIVSLTGHPAEGDLFTTLFIDFSGLSAGGVLGELIWSTDIDTVATAGDLVPVPPLITTNTVVDSNDDFSWATCTDTFEAGVLVLRELTFDNGRHLDTTYTDGVKSATLETDTSDTANWQTQAISFDALGERTSLTKTYDDGRVLDVTYEDGIKTQASITDTQDVYRWESSVDTFDFNGDRVLHETVFDDGRQADTTYEDGVKTSQVISDGADVFNWVTTATEYDTAGQVTNYSKTYDDGRVLEETYEHGAKTLATLTDEQDIYRWDNQVTTFDPDGTPVSRQITYDDCTIRTISYLEDLSIV